MNEEYVKAATLENEIEARLLDSVLNERNVPHRITSYYDTAYDGLYQTQKGWGHISAPGDYLEEIREIIAIVRKGSHDRDSE